jgi:hypothetical protein
MGSRGFAGTGARDVSTLQVAAPEPGALPRLVDVGEHVRGVPLAVVARQLAITRRFPPSLGPQRDAVVQQLSLPAGLSLAQQVAASSLQSRLDSIWAGVPSAGADIPWGFGAVLAAPTHADGKPFQCCLRCDGALVPIPFDARWAPGTFFYRDCVHPEAAVGLGRVVRQQCRKCSDGRRVEYGLSSYELLEADDDGKFQRVAKVPYSACDSHPGVVWPVPTRLAQGCPASVLLTGSDRP